MQGSTTSERVNYGMTQNSAPNPKTIRPQNLKTLSIFVFLAAIWGASFLFMRLSSPEFGAVPTAFVRVFIAAMALMVVSVILKKPPIERARLPWSLGIGILNSAVPFALFSYATLSLPAGYTAVLNATVPFWGLAIGAVFFKQNVTAMKLAALCVAVLGLAMMLGLSALPMTASVLLAAGACLLATFCYGWSGHFALLKLKGIDAFAQARGAMMGATLALAPFAAAQWPAQMPSSGAWAALAALGLVCSALAYILYFWIIHHAGLNLGLSVTLLIPVFGIAWGMLFLGEGLTLPSALGALIALMGTSVVIGLWVPFGKS